MRACTCFFHVRRPLAGGACRHRARASAEMAEPGARLAGLGARALLELKRSRCIASYQDLLTHLARALNTQPALARVLQARYGAALIDEFQDTDPLQFDIFQRIFAPRGPLFLVGDPKQAIYSFRAADLHTYLRARRAASGHATLAVNQRACAALI